MHVCLSTNTAGRAPFRTGASSSLPWRSFAKFQPRDQVPPLHAASNVAAGPRHREIVADSRRRQVFRGADCFVAEPQTKAPRASLVALLSSFAIAGLLLLLHRTSDTGNGITPTGFSSYSPAPRFRVSFPASLHDAPITGRLMVCIAKKHAVKDPQGRTNQGSWWTTRLLPSRFLPLMCGTSCPVTLGRRTVR